jgi:acyl carrier protein
MSSRLFIFNKDVTMTKEEFLTELANILNEDSLTEEQPLADISAFDSMGVMSVIVVIQRELKTKVNVNELLICKKVGDIIQLVADKLS